MGDEIKGVVEVTEKIDALGKNVNGLVDRIEDTGTRIDEVKQSWQQDYADLVAKIKSVDKPEADPEIKRALVGLVDQVIADRNINRVPMASERGAQFGEFKCANPYDFELGENAYGLGMSDFDTSDLLKTGRKGFGEFLDRPPLNDQHRNLQRVGDDVWLLDSLARAVQGNNYNGFAKTFPRLGNTWGRLIKGVLQSYGIKADADAMDTSDTGNWIPTAYSSQLRDLIKASLRVAALFERVRMPTPDYKLPVNLTDVVADKIAETTDLAGAPSGDTNTQVLDDVVATLSAVKHRGRMVISGELIEDAIIPVLPLLRRTVAEALGNAEEQAILDGDTTATHMDSDVTAATDARKSFYGIRRYCHYGDATNAFATDLNTFTAETVLDLPGNMGEYGYDPMETVYVTGFAGLTRLIKLQDSNGNLVTATVDKYGGDGATLLTGEMARCWGRPVVVSRYVRQNLAATGFYTGTGATTYLACVHRRGWIIGDRREVTFEAVRHAVYDQNEVIAFRRLAFTNTYGTINNASAKAMGWVGYNVDLS